MQRTKYFFKYGLSVSLLQFISHRLRFCHQEFDDIVRVRHVNVVLIDLFLEELESRELSYREIVANNCDKRKKLILVRDVYLLTINTADSDLLFWVTDWCCLRVSDDYKCQFHTR